MPGANDSPLLHTASPQEQPRSSATRGPWGVPAVPLKTQLRHRARRALSPSRLTQPPGKRCGPHSCFPFFQEYLLSSQREKWVSVGQTFPSTCSLGRVESSWPLTSQGGGGGSLARGTHARLALPRVGPAVVWPHARLPGCFLGPGGLCMPRE